MLLFNEKDSWTYKELTDFGDKSGMDIETVQGIMVSLFRMKEKILNKTGDVISSK